jgi:hypothetical protein
VQHYRFGAEEERALGPSATAAGPWAAAAIADESTVRITIGAFRVGLSINNFRKATPNLVSEEKARNIKFFISLEAPVKRNELRFDI